MTRVTDDDAGAGVASPCIDVCRMDEAGTARVLAHPGRNRPLGVTPAMTTSARSSTPWRAGGSATIRPATGVALAMAEASRPALPDSIQVIERGWLSSNNVLMFEGESATLVDAGYVGHAPQTVALVKSALAGRRNSSGLGRIINTHSHSDHIGGNAALQAEFGCRIVIPAGIERMVAEWDTEALLLDQAKQQGERFAHDGVIAAGDEFEMGGLVWQALAAPGHDMEALIYHCAEQRILISGDALWQDGFGIIFGEILGATMRCRPRAAPWKPSAALASISSSPVTARPSTISMARWRGPSAASIPSRPIPPASAATPCVPASPSTCSTCNACAKTNFPAT